jgi:hypothetical protein
MLFTHGEEALIYPTRRQMAPGKTPHFGASLWTWIPIAATLFPVTMSLCLTSGCVFAMRQCAIYSDVLSDPVPFFTIVRVKIPAGLSDFC